LKKKGEKNERNYEVLHARPPQKNRFGRYTTG
jgi:hypothetical protein